MSLKRIKQVISYGWQHASEITLKENKNLFFRLKIFFDIIYCYNTYLMWSNQYLIEEFWKLSKEGRHSIGGNYKTIGKKRDQWQTDFQETRKFLIKYSDIKYEADNLRDARNKAYTKYYKTGCGLMVENNVNISRQHYLDGSISIGNNVLLAKNVFIDYSGNLIIKDNVQLTNGVIIETHHHAFHSDFKESRNRITSSSLLIGEGAVIGSRAIILDSCNYIGKHARIGAGAVVTKDIPDYAVAVGVPAKIIRINN